jgi:glycosyltransferase involved in cell wall biosynthesis
MSRPRTLIFAKKFRLPSPAANIIQTLNMAWGFQAAGAHVKIFPGRIQKGSLSLLSEIEKEYRLDTNSRPKVTFLAGRNKGIYGLLFRAALLKEWLTNPDALFFSRDVKETMLLLTLKKLFQKQQKIVYEMHDSVFLEHQEYGEKDAQTYKIWEKRIISGVDGIIYTGTYLKKKVEEIYTSSTPSLIAVPGFNKRIFYPLPPVKNSKTVLIGYFGSLHPGKGVSLLLDAFKMLPDHYRLRIIGGNPAHERVALENRVHYEFSNPDRVEFAGQVSPCDVRNHLKGCQMITIPFVSDVEFLSPIKLYEALAMGLPVVATPVPAVQSAAAELPNVIISSSSQPEDIADAIRYLGEHPDRITRIHQKTIALKSMPDWENRARRIDAFISAL